MNCVLLLVLMNPGARWTTETTQCGANDLQTLLQIRDPNINVASLRTATTASDLADSALLQRIEQWIFDFIATLKWRVGVLESNLQEYGLDHNGVVEWSNVPYQ